MRTVAEAFDECRKRLEITKTEKDDAARRQKEVRAHVRSDFDVSRDILTGSYARHTKTKPLKDVDVFFILGSEERARRMASPRSTLDAFEASLLKHYTRGQVSRGRRSISITFDRSSPTQSEDGKVLSVDVVPAFDADNGYDIPDDHLGDWVATNPEIHKEKAIAKNAALASRWVPLVKMLKGWNREAGSPIKPSFLIEVMALDLVDPPWNSFADEVRTFFAAAVDTISDTWADPAGLGPPVSDQMTLERCADARLALYEAEKLAAQAARAEERDRIGEALALWRQLFGSYFPSR